MPQAIDRIIAGFGLVLLSPLMLLVALVVRVTMGGPVLFKQVRAGQGGASFTLVKFRTMTDERAPNGELRSDAERLTKAGSFLRSTSLDELPELVNVLRGEMALVGPRPLPVSYLDRYTDAEARRHEVRPGITGWAQVNGRNTVSWDERLAMDVWYVDNRSLLLDLQILVRTFTTVVRRDGVTEEGHATMSELRPPGER